MHDFFPTIFLIFFGLCLHFSLIYRSEIYGLLFSCKVPRERKKESYKDKINPK